MIDRRALLLVTAGLCACGSSSDTPPATTPPAEGTSTEVPTGSAPEGTTTTTESPSGEGDPQPTRPTGAPRVRYALARHVPRAELRQGETLVLDMGVPGAAKYTCAVFAIVVVFPSGPTTTGASRMQLSTPNAAFVTGPVPHRTTRSPGVPAASGGYGVNTAADVHSASSPVFSSNRTGPAPQCTPETP